MYQYNGRIEHSLKELVSVKSLPCNLKSQHLRTIRTGYQKVGEIRRRLTKAEVNPLHPQARPLGPRCGGAPVHPAASCAPSPAQGAGQETDEKDSFAPSNGTGSATRNRHQNAAPAVAKPSPVTSTSQETGDRRQVHQPSGLRSLKEGLIVQ